MRKTQISSVLVVLILLACSCNKSASSSEGGSDAAGGGSSKSKKDDPTGSGGDTTSSTVGALSVDTAKSAASKVVDATDPKLFQLKRSEIAPAATTKASAGSLKIDTASLSLTTSKKDIDRAESKFTWDQAAQPLKNSEKFRCMLALTEYEEELVNAMRERVKTDPDEKDEAAGTYRFDIHKVFTKDVKESVIKAECFRTDGSQVMMNSNDASANKIVQFVVDLKESITVNNKASTTSSAQVDGIGITYGELKAKFWFDISKSVVSEGGYAGATGGSGTSTPMVSYYGALNLTSIPSPENPQGVSKVQWTAYEKINGVEGDKVQSGILDLKLDGSTPVRMFREEFTNRQTWGTGTNMTGYEQTTSQVANVRYTPRSEGATHSKAYDGSVARTATNYTWTPIPNTYSYAPTADQSGSFSFAWFAGEGRSMTKWVPATGVQQWWNATYYDPTAPSCTDTDHLTARVMNYGTYTMDGDEIVHRTYISINTNKTDSWGWPIMGGIGSWGLWLYGVDNGETVYADGDGDGEEEAYTYVTLPGRMRNSNWEEIIPTSTISYNCTSQCPMQNITDSSNWQETNAGTYYYTLGTDRKLYYHGNSLSNAGVAVVLDNAIDNAWINVNLTVDSGPDQGQTNMWAMERSRWVNANLSKTDGSWFDTYSASNYGNDNIQLRCTSNCLKTGITASDITNGTKYLTGTGNGAGGSHCYVYVMNYWEDWSKNYKLYHDPNCNGFETGENIVEFASGVASGNVSMELLTASDEAVKYSVTKTDYNQPGGVVRNGTWLVAPKPVHFQNFTITSDMIYEGAPSASALGKSTGDNDITYGQGLWDYGWGMGWIAWGDTGIKDAYGNSTWGPIVGFKKGVTMVPENTSGRYVQGTAIQIAPKGVEMSAPSVSDCTASMLSTVNDIPNQLALPDNTNLPFVDVRDLIGTRPAVGAELRLRLKLKH